MLFSNEIRESSRGSLPCCLKIIDCEEFDNLFEGYEDKEYISGVAIPHGGTVGQHHYCPKDADEAAHLAWGIHLITFLLTEL